MKTVQEALMHSYTLFDFFCAAIILILLYTTLIDIDGTFIKNILFFPFMLAMYGYVIYFALRALMRAFKAENEANKTQYLLITVYSVPITAGMILRYYYLDVPTFSIGATISTLIIYIFEVRGQVSLDALTGVNNRRIGERFFINHIQEINSASYSSVGGLYLFMIDLNKFKSINDTFGHAEGDRALVTTAEALKEACNPFKSRCNLSRFGGDEFVIDAMLSGAEESEYLTRRIEDAIIRKNAALNAPYTVSASIGCERYKKDYKTLKTFLSAADKMMYKEKEKHHLQWNLKTAKKRKNR